MFHNLDFREGDGEMNFREGDGEKKFREGDGEMKCLFVCLFYYGSLLNLQQSGGEKYIPIADRYKTRTYDSNTHRQRKTRKFGLINWPMSTGANAIKTVQIENFDFEQQL